MGCKKRLTRKSLCLGVDFLEPEEKEGDVRDAFWIFAIIVALAVLVYLIKIKK